MAFCIQDCVDFDDSFTDSDCEYDDDVWTDDESHSSSSQLNVHYQDSNFNSAQSSQLGVKDRFTFMNDTHRPVYANPINFCRISLGECQVCYYKVGVVYRPCCKFVLCKSCFQLYVAEKVQLGMTEIECPNTCSYRINPHDIVEILPFKFKEKYRLLQMAEMQSPFSKACFCCGNFIFFKEDVSDSKKTKLICLCCGIALCVSCLMPWHPGVPCRWNQKGDKLLKSWAKGFLPGQPKAQKCPKCKIYIERITGCDHMTCTKCGTSFCYRCGEAFRSWKAFGDHSSKFSVFGCKYAFLPNKPFYRKLIRGSLFSTRVFAAVTIGTLAIGVGSAAVCVGAAALPFYGAVRMYQQLKRKRKSSIPESVGPASTPTNCYLIRKIPNISDETEQKMIPEKSRFNVSEISNTRSD